MNYYTLFLLFIMYSFSGWLLEVICKLVEKKKFINRGFLIGPICPIYGCGSILIILLLERYKSNLFILFGMAIIICSILEYMTSYIMEKLFNLRWWDYSSKKYNLNGRICLNTMIPFGILGCTVIYIINPFFLFILNNFNINTLELISIILFIIFIIDITISFGIIYNFKESIKNVGDSTEAISKKVKDILLSRNYVYKRLIKAFPNIKSPKERLLEIRKRIDNEIKKYNKNI